MLVLGILTAGVLRTFDLAFSKLSKTRPDRRQYSEVRQASTFESQDIEDVETIYNLSK